MHECVEKGSPLAFRLQHPEDTARYFLYDRKLLHDLSHCAWESLQEFLQAVTHEKNPLPGAVIAIQTFGDILSFCLPYSRHGWLLLRKRDVPGSPSTWN